MRAKMILAILLLGVLAGSASATTIAIDFSTGGATGGTVIYAGAGVPGDGPMVGTGIGIGFLQGVNTPIPRPNPIPFLGDLHWVSNGFTGFGSLSFETGNFISYSGGIYNFGLGGYLTITGAVPDAGITSPVILVSAPMIAGQFNSASGKLAFVVGNDTKNQDLLNWFGLTSPTYPNLWELSGTIHVMNIVGGTGAGFTADAAKSTNVQNTLAPEPATMSLLGLGIGLIGLGGYFRRRRQ